MIALAHALRLFVATYGLAALFLVLVVEEAGIWLPLPGDVLIMYLGYEASRSSAPLLAVLPVVATVMFAALCGSLVLYSVTRRCRGIVRRFGRLAHLNEHRLAQMERWLRRRGALVIIPGRLLPGLRIPTTVVSGLSDLPLPVFLSAVAVAAALWASFYVLLGAMGPALLTVGRRLLAAEPLPDAPGEWLVCAVVGVLMLASVVLVQRRRAMPSPT